MSKKFSILCVIFALCMIISSIPISAAVVQPDIEPQAAHTCTLRYGYRWEYYCPYRYMYNYAYCINNGTGSGYDSCPYNPSSPNYNESLVIRDESVFYDPHDYTVETFISCNRPRVNTDNYQTRCGKINTDGSGCAALDGITYTLACYGLHA